MTKPSSDVMSVPEFNQFRGHLLGNPPTGVEPGDWSDTITEIFGTSPDGRTRKMIRLEIEAWMKDFTKT